VVEGDPVRQRLGHQLGVQAGDGDVLLGLVGLAAGGAEVDEVGEVVEVERVARHAHEERRHRQRHGEDVEVREAARQAQVLQPQEQRPALGRDGEDPVPLAVHDRVQAPAVEVGAQRAVEEAAGAQDVVVMVARGPAFRRLVGHTPSLRRGLGAPGTPRG
jgi:hypothetical protein